MAREVRVVDIPLGSLIFPLPDPTITWKALKLLSAISLDVRRRRVVIAIRPLSAPPMLLAERDEQVVTLPVSRAADIPVAHTIWGRNNPPPPPLLRMDRKGPHNIGTTATAPMRQQTSPAPLPSPTISQRHGHHLDRFNYPPKACLQTNQPCLKGNALVTRPPYRLCERRRTFLILGP